MGGAVPATAPPVTVLVADDNDRFRSGMVRALNARAGFEVVGDVNDGALALDAIRALRPDVALLDARMPVIDGLELTGLLASDPDLIDTKIVLLSAQADGRIVDEARAAGAHAFLDKTQPRRTICEAILVTVGRVVPD